MTDQVNRDLQFLFLKIANYQLAQEAHKKDFLHFSTNQEQ